MPDGAAIEAMVGAAIGLQTTTGAGGAGRALVEPVAVGVQAVLDVIGVDVLAEAFGQAFGFFPGLNF